LDFFIFGRSLSSSGGGNEMLGARGGCFFFGLLRFLGVKLRKVLRLRCNKERLMILVFHVKKFHLFQFDQYFRQEKNLRIDLMSKDFLHCMRFYLLMDISTKDKISRIPLLL
jgi:hypothetical protein